MRQLAQRPSTVTPRVPQRQQTEAGRAAGVGAGGSPSAATDWTVDTLGCDGDVSERMVPARSVLVGGGDGGGGGGVTLRRLLVDERGIRRASGTAASGATPRGPVGFSEMELALRSEAVLGAVLGADGGPDVRPCFDFVMRCASRTPRCSRLERKRRSHRAAKQTSAMTVAIANRPYQADESQPKSKLYKSMAR